MSFFIVLIAISIIVGIGYSCITCFGLLPKTTFFSLLGYSYGLGVGIIALQLYTYSRLGIPWNKGTILIPWGILLLFTFINERKQLRLPNLKYSLTKIQLVLFIAIIMAGAYVVFEAILRPVFAWDAWAIWLQKSQIFFIDRHIRPAIFTYVKSDYPLVISLLGTFIYILLSKVNDTSVLLAFFAFYVFLACLFFSVVKNKFGTTYALFFTLLLVTTQTIIRQGGRLEAGQADLAVGYYGFISFALLEEYLQKSEGKLLVLLSIFLGFTGLIKFDGIPITVVIGLFALLHIVQKKLYSHIFLLLFWILPLAEWQLYKKSINLTFTYFAGHQFTFSAQKTIDTTIAQIRELVNIKSWNFLWITYIYTLIVLRVKKFSELFRIHCIILSQLGIYTLLYFFTLGNNPESSFERLLVHIAPLALYAIVLSTNKLLKAKQMKVSTNL